MTEQSHFGSSPLLPESLYGKFHDKLICSMYFLETQNKCNIRTMGAWLLQIDSDSLNMMMSGLLKLSNLPKVDVNILLNDPRYEEIATYYVDFMAMVFLGHQWETNRELKNEGLVVEYFYRLAKLIQAEFARRNNISLPEEWIDKYDGKLVIA